MLITIHHYGPLRTYSENVGPEPFPLFPLVCGPRAIMAPDLSEWTDGTIVLFLLVGTIPAVGGESLTVPLGRPMFAGYSGPIWAMYDRLTLGASGLWSRTKLPALPRSRFAVGRNPLFSREGRELCAGEVAYPVQSVARVSNEVSIQRTIRRAS